MSERFRPGRGGNDDGEHRGIKPSRESKRRRDQNGEADPQNSREKPAKKPKGTKKRKTNNQISTGIDEYHHRNAGAEEEPAPHPNELSAHTNSIIQAFSEGITEHENSKKKEWESTSATDIDTKGVEKYRKTLRKAGKIMQDDMDRLSREDASDPEVEALQRTISSIQNELLSKEELLEQQRVLTSTGFSPHRLSPEGKDVFNALTDEDIQSILHTKGGSPRIVEFLKKGLGYEVVSVNTANEPSFLDKEGFIVLSKGHGTTFRVKPFDLWNLLRTAWIESSEEEKKVPGIFDPVDVGQNNLVSGEEVKRVRDRFLSSDDGEVEDEGTYDQVNNVFKRTNLQLSDRDDTWENTKDLEEANNEVGGNVVEELDSTEDLTGTEDKRSVVRNIVANSEGNDLDSTHPEDWSALSREGEGVRNETDDFVEQMGRLGLRVINVEGDKVTFQGEMPGAPIQTLNKSELLEFIHGEEESETPETHIVPPRLEEETDEHGNALLTPAELHKRFVQPTLREEFVGPHIPEDLRKVRQSIEDLPAEERDSDVANAPLTPDSSEPYRKLIEQARENIKKHEVPFFDTRFQSEFNISEKDLESIEGYTTLSPAQKKLLFENLSQVTLRNVKEEAERLCTEHANQKRLDLVEKVNVVLGTVLASFREVITRDRDRIGTEKEVLKNMREGGIEVHRNILEQLVTGVLTFGPRIHEAENGKLLADLVNIRERATGELRGEEWLVSEKLNRAAHEFAKIPASWRGNTIGVDDGSEWKITAFIKDKIKIFTSDERKHQRVYEEAKSEYEQARKELANVLLKKGLGEAQVMAKIIEIDSRVYQLQTIQTNPDALAELGNIENQEFWKEVGQKLAFPGMYLGLGLLGRSLLSLGGAAVAAPIVSGGVAWLRSWNSSADALRSRDEKARAGIEDTGEGALNVVTAEDLIQKTLRILDRYRKETDPEKIVSLLAQLQARVKYVNTKQEKRQINYGKRENSLMAQIELTETLGEALAVIAREDLASTLVVQDRLQKSDRRVGKRLSETEKMILSARLEGRNSEALRSAEKAAAFSLAGSLIADFYHNWRADSLSRQSLSSSPQTAFKGDVPFVPAPIVNGETDVQGGVSFEERIPVGRDLDQLMPRTAGIDTLEGTESDPGTLNNSPRIETDATVATEINTGTYTIKSGDTLTKILKEQIPEIKELSTPQARETAVAKVLARLTPNELRAIGIESEKADIIRAGDRIDIAKLKEMVNVDLGLTETSGVVEQGASISSEAPRSPAVRGEGVPGTTILQEQLVRPGPIRPESSSLTPSTASVTPRAEVVSPPNNVVELAPLREAKVVQERVIETLKLKKDWSAVSGRFTSDLSEAVRTNSAESPALRRALKDALFAEQTLTKTLKLEERTNETVGEFMKRAAKEIAKLSPEAQNELYEKITPKGRGIFDSGEAVFRPGQVRPGSIEHGVSPQATPEAIVAPRPPEQSPVASKPAPEAPEAVVLRGDVPPPKMSAEFNRYLINGRQIPLQSWVALRDKPVSNFEFMDIHIGDVLKDPTVPSDTKKMIFLRRLLFEETGLAGKSGEKLEDYFKRTDDFIQGHEEVKDRYLNRIVGPYQEFVREIDNTSTYESSPKKGGWRVRPSFRMR